MCSLSRARLFQDTLKLLFIDVLILNVPPALPTTSPPKEEYALPAQLLTQLQINSVSTSVGTTCWTRLKNVTTATLMTMTDARVSARARWSVGMGSSIVLRHVMIIILSRMMGVLFVKQNLDMHAKALLQYVTNHAQMELQKKQKYAMTAIQFKVTAALIVTASQAISVISILLSAFRFVETD